MNNFIKDITYKLTTLLNKMKVNTSVNKQYQFVNEYGDIVESLLNYLNSIPTEAKNDLTQDLFYIQTIRDSIDNIIDKY